MNARKTFFVWIFLLFVFQSLCATPLGEQFKRAGYVEICDRKHGAATFDSSTAAETTNSNAKGT